MALGFRWPDLFQNHPEPCKTRTAQQHGSSRPLGTPMSQPVNAGRDWGVAVVCVQLCTAQCVSSKCLCDALCMVFPLQHVVQGY